MVKPYYDFDLLDAEASKVMTAIVAVWVEKEGISKQLHMSEEEAIWALCGLVEKGFAQVYAQEDKDGDMSFWIEVDEDMMEFAKPTIN